MIIIDTPKIEHCDSNCIVSSKLMFGSSDKEKKIWLKVDNRYQDFISDNPSDGFLIAILPYALYNNLDIKVAKPISQTLNHNFSQIVTLIDTIYNTGNKIRLLANLRSDLETGGDSVITGFSAGVDSFCTLKDYFYQCAHPAYRITHLIFNNVGSHGLSEESSDLFNERFCNQEEKARLLGLPLIKVDTNFNTFCPSEFVNYQQFGNSAVSHILSKKITKYLYSGAYDYKEIIHGSNSRKDFAHTDASLLPLLSTGGSNIIVFRKLVISLI